MCGRYEYTPGEFREIRIRWNLDKDVPLFKPCYNIAPGREVAVIVQEIAGRIRDLE
jgi:putative SOS response-associated peptidase YedK